MRSQPLDTLCYKAEQETASLWQIVASSGLFFSARFTMKVVSDPPAVTRVALKPQRHGPRRQSRRFKRILVPIDFSRPSLKAIPYALAISRQFGADVHLLHVTDVAQQPPPTVPTLPHVPQSEWNRRLMKRLQALAQKYRSDGKVSALEPRVGTASREICKVAVELNVDLIVIATHGYIGRKRMFLGSTAERVVQHSSCAVLVVREHRAYSNGSVDPRTPTGFRLKKILAPTDFSECSRAGSDYAFRLAREFKAELRLIHVINPHAHPFSDPYAVLNTDNFLDEAGRAAQKKLYTMAAKSKARCSVRVIHGSAAAEICNPGDDDVDLIVLSTHGRTGLRHFLMGSVAEHVVRYAQCPVLVIPTRPNTASSSKLVNNANS